ncbi:ribonuclease P protein component [Pseudooceanicola sp. HF7]|uniref:ribonuclease P protein component n=1 Tax=Pseudooceanicola sp. HF7 TaxID=2721560 RepID=UPI0014322904|nr:ribonuclease P protein component [Pseudooceanicola sp. HF7]NIZ08265.1 ribonuclease P protein component [Pseudooceanicola sp. HF7]
MTPPKALPETAKAEAPGQASAVSLCADTSLPGSRRSGVLNVLTKRSDFLLAARAKRQGTPAMMVQARKRAEDGVVRVGFTCSKKVGNAVARNRAKRRLREIARQVLPTHGHPGWDYVLIGRKDATAERNFALLVQDLEQALRKIHGSAGERS